MLFSIIVPVHNSEETITRCVESIIKQNNDVQVILVENGSIDDTIEVCRKLESQYKDVELYVSKEKGTSFARNLGLQHIKGDIIGFCDADDYYADDALHKVSSIFENNDVDIVISGFTRVHKKGSYSRLENKERIVKAGKAIEYVNCSENIMGSVWNKFYKKNLISNFSFPTDLSHLEDGYFNNKLLASNRNAKVYISRINTYFYMQNDSSVTGNIDNCFDDAGKLQYNIALHKILESVDLNFVEKMSVRDAIYRISMDNIEKVRKDANLYNNLYEELLRNIVPFSFRVFMFNKKDRVKLLLKGAMIILKGKE